MNHRHDFTPTQIARAGRNLVVPFGLSLASANLGDLDVETLLRLLPGKRLTAVARWHGKRVVIKLFVDPARWQHHWQEEMQGHEALVEAHIATPKLLSSEQHADEAWAIMVYEWLTPSESGDRYWQRLMHTNDTPLQDALLTQLGVLTARLHDHHLIQWDNHLDNFVIKKDQAMVVDSGGVKRQTRISPAQSLSNLALLASQFPVLDDAQITRLREAYEGARKNGGSPIPAAALMREIQHLRRLRLQDYMEKCQRECTDVTITHPRPGHVMAARRTLIGSELLAWSQDPHPRVEEAVRLKDGNSQTVAATELDGRAVVIKRYNIKNVSHWLRRLGRTTRARNAWTASHALHLLKIPTPQPVAMVEQALGPFHGPAFYVAERCEGETLDVALSQQPELLDVLLPQMLQLCNTLFCHRISHGDFKANNFIVNQQHLWVIDLDAVQFHRSDLRFAKAFRKDIERLLRNWAPDSVIHQRLTAALAPFVEACNGLSGASA